ncbi:hypothetical protein SKAU_G00420820 [Synaphobranchus kaupii]|uniref:Uncharacterized protein n=1 Tax=Synaphobranchus kaupii TaxID=118154 RepID=A0A9Q1E6N2_SYNKA|nr:hypothetical protein SKAU_G00420820 [Synaphobranchus kaupii]
MDPKSGGEKARPRYFSNVKTRLGSRLPASAPPTGFISGPWEPTPCSGPAAVAREGGAGQHRPPGTHPPHVPHIRNPQLRKYYLRGDVTHAREVM